MVWLLVLFLAGINVVAFAPSLLRRLRRRSPGLPVQVPSEAPRFQCSGCGVQAVLVTWTVVSHGEQTALRYTTQTIHGGRCACRPESVRMLPLNAEARAMEELLPMLRRDIAFDIAFNPSSTTGARA